MSRQNRFHQKESYLKTFSTGFLVVILVSLMGWCAIPFPEPTPPPTLTTDKAEIVRLQTAAMKQAHESYINWLIARGNK